MFNTNIWLHGTIPAPHSSSVISWNFLVMYFPSTLSTTTFRRLSVSWTCRAIFDLSSQFQTTQCSKQKIYFLYFFFLFFIAPVGMVSTRLTKVRAAIELSQKTRSGSSVTLNSYEADQICLTTSNEKQWRMTQCVEIMEICQPIWPWCKLLNRICCSNWPNCKKISLK